MHLLKFLGQAMTAKQNEKKFKNAYALIMSGVNIETNTLGKKYFPKNDRIFDDYGAYIAKQGTLWAWSKKGLLQSKESEVPNRGHLVYFNQSICELLEYGDMLHRRLFQLVSNPQSIEAALKARENLVNLELAMSKVSGYAEISDLLSKGWNSLGVPRLQDAITDMIRIRETETSIKEGRNLAFWQIILSAIFGIVAVPGFASELLKPVWNLT